MGLSTGGGGGSRKVSSGGGARASAAPSSEASGDARARALSSRGALLDLSGDGRARARARVARRLARRRGVASACSGRAGREQAHARAHARSHALRAGGASVRAAAQRGRTVKTTLLLLTNNALPLSVAVSGPHLQFRRLGRLEIKALASELCHFDGDRVEYEAFINSFRIVEGLGWSRAGSSSFDIG